MRNPMLARFLWEDEREEPVYIGATLSNPCNTCFLNSILQCLTHTVPLVEKFIKLDYCFSCACGSQDFCPLFSLKQHIEFCLSKPGNRVIPYGFLQHFSREQQDAHEFLQCLLNRVHDCCVSNMSGNEPLSLEKDSLIKQIFGGRLRSRLQCCDCGHTSDTYEPLLDLSLDIDDDVDNLHDALRLFTKVEEIDPETKFSCEGCKARVSMKKQLTLDKIPQVVAFHFKRFKIEGNSVHKIQKSVHFPRELNLQQFRSFPEAEEISNYELYAVVMHVGPLPNEGHYFCILRSPNDIWVCLNDEKVFEWTNLGSLSYSAYILFYIEQGSAPTLSSLMKREFLQLPRVRFANYPANKKWAVGEYSHNNPNAKSDERDDQTSNQDASGVEELTSNPDSSPLRHSNQDGILNWADNEASQRRSCGRLGSEHGVVDDLSEEPSGDEQDKQEETESSAASKEGVNEVQKGLVAVLPISRRPKLQPVLSSLSQSESFYARYSPMMRKSCRMKKQRLATQQHNEDPSPSSNTSEEMPTQPESRSSP